MKLIVKESQLIDLWKRTCMKLWPFWLQHHLKRTIRHRFMTCLGTVVFVVVAVVVGCLLLTMLCFLWSALSMLSLLILLPLLMLFFLYWFLRG